MIYMKLLRFWFSASYSGIKLRIRTSGDLVYYCWNNINLMIIVGDLITIMMLLIFQSSKMESSDLFWLIFILELQFLFWIIKMGFCLFVLMLGLGHTSRRRIWLAQWKPWNPGESCIYFGFHLPGAQLYTTFDMSHITL